MAQNSAQPLSALAFCWRLERADGGGVAVTSHDQDLVRGGVVYRASPGIEPAAISKSTGLEPTSAEVAGALRTDALTEQDLHLGRWDGCRVALLATDWSNVEDVPVELLNGELGEVATDGDSFSAELRGAAARLDAPVCPLTTPECRAEFGDPHCRVDLAGRHVHARVVGQRGCELELDRSFDSRYLFGRLRYLSGASCGLATVVLEANGPLLRVRDLPKLSIEPGCRVEIREGCDKRFTTCTERFDNAINFRGEPHLPGNDLLTRYPGS